MERFIALFDILGFGHIVRTNQIGRVADAFREFARSPAMWNSFLRDVNKVERIGYKLFSDTLLAYSIDASPESLKDILNFAQMLIGGSLPKDMLLRGAITKGEVIVEDDLFLGVPIVKAYEMERQQEWVGCWVGDECFASLRPGILEDERKVIVLPYEVPLKVGRIETRWAVNWTWCFVLFGDDIRGIVTAAFDRFAGEDHRDWAVKRKLENTVAFAEYAFALSRRTREEARGER